MAQVEVQAGSFRSVARLNREAVGDTGLVPGAAVAAMVRSTHVSLERIGDQPG